LKPYLEKASGLMEHSKDQVSLSIPELILISATRGMLGVGIGLLLSNRLPAEQRKAVGGTLFAVGLFTTIPLGFEVFGGGRYSKSRLESKQAA
jgi:hypothetical protein